MPETVQQTPEETAEPSFAAFVQAENAKELEAKGGTVPAPVASESEQERVSEAAASGAVESATVTGQPAQTPVEPVESKTEAKADEKDPDAFIRNHDGTFRKRSPRDRINLAVARQRAAEQRAADFERQLTALRTQASVPASPAVSAEPRSTAQSAVPPVSGPPTLEQFLDRADPHADWMTALAGYQADQRIQAFDSRSCKSSRIGPCGIG